MHNATGIPLIVPAMFGCQDWFGFQNGRQLAKKQKGGWALEAWTQGGVESLKGGGGHKTKLAHVNSCCSAFQKVHEDIRGGSGNV